MKLLQPGLKFATICFLHPILIFQMTLRKHQADYLMEIIIAVKREKEKAEILKIPTKLANLKLLLYFFK